jgi:hypothetical protein
MLATLSLQRSLRFGALCAGTSRRGRRQRLGGDEKDRTEGGSWNDVYVAR